MSFIPWEEKYALGISEIDEQHQKMLTIINKLYEIFEDKKNNDPLEIDKVISEVVDYAIYHFQTEERYFELFGYEKSKEHIAIHNQYRERMAEWQKRYNESRDGKIFFEVSNFLHDWWVWHINNTDREYVSLFKENGLE